jgi:hypothetical protein
LVQVVLNTDTPPYVLGRSSTSVFDTDVDSSIVFSLNDWSIRSNKKDGLWMMDEMKEKEERTSE